MKAFRTENRRALFLVLDKNIINNRNGVTYIGYNLIAKKEVIIGTSPLNHFEKDKSYIEISIKTGLAMLESSLKTLTFKSIFKVFERSS